MPSHEWVKEQKPKHFDENPAYASSTFDSSTVWPRDPMQVSKTHDSITGLLLLLSKTMMGIYE